ncbi:MAG: hypothetical protein AAGG01_19730 [Planctomycetota bacterium]
MPTSEEQPVAILRWHLSKERSQRESELAIATRTRWLRRAHWLVPLLLVISASAIATQRELVRSGEAAKAVTLATGFVALMGLLMAVDVAWKRWVKEPGVARRLWKDREAMTGTEVRIELFDDTIRYQGPQSTGTFSWSAIEDVARRDDDLLLTPPSLKNSVPRTSRPRKRIARLQVTAGTSSSSSEHMTPQHLLRSYPHPLCVRSSLSLKI